MRVLVEANGLELELEDTPLGSGGEATVHAVNGQAEMVAKLYRKPALEHAAKLAAMIAAPPTDLTAKKHLSIAWPTSQLLAPGGDRRFLGYLMPRVHDARLLYEIFNPRMRQQSAPGFHFSHLLRVARNLSAAVRTLHERGYVIGDVNESNILVNREAIVTLIDTDSFQVRAEGQVYRCRVGKPEYTPPELQRSRFAEVDRAPEHDAFGLAVLIFQLLMQGTHPFTGVYTGPGEPGAIPRWIEAGYFPYAWGKSLPVKPGPHAPPWKVLPAVVQELMRCCFENGHAQPAVRPTAADWLTALVQSESELTQCKDKPQHHYPRVLSDGCPWCVMDLCEGRNPLPALPAQDAPTFRGTERPATHTLQRPVSGPVKKLPVPLAVTLPRRRPALAASSGGAIHLVAAGTPTEKRPQQRPHGLPFLAKLSAGAGAFMLLLVVVAIVTLRSGPKNLNAQLARPAMETPAPMALLTQPVIAADPKKDPDPDPEPDPLELGLGNGVKMELVLIKKGRFKMGSTDSDKYAQPDEKPQHEVEISKDFYMARSPVTQEQYRRIMGTNPSYFNKEKVGMDTSRFPVERVTWTEAQAFCKKATAMTKRRVELPTEAQWEYACRAGTTTRFFCGDELSDNDANINQKLSRTTEVGKYPPNPWGRYDMAGNVWQWCADGPRTYTANTCTDPFGAGDSDRVVRGGSWSRYPAYCRSTYRVGFAPSTRGDNFGFRVLVRLD